MLSTAPKYETMKIKSTEEIDIKRKIGNIGNKGKIGYTRKLYCPMGTFINLLWLVCIVSFRVSSKHPKYEFIQTDNKRLL